MASKHAGAGRHVRTCRQPVAPLSLWRGVINRCLPPLDGKRRERRVDIAAGAAWKTAISPRAPWLLHRARAADLVGHWG